MTPAETIVYLVAVLKVIWPIVRYHGTPLTLVSGMNPSPSRPRILIVEPDPTQRVAVAAFFDRDYEVGVADSATEGIALLRQRGADVVVTELDLPDRYGPAFLAEVHEAMPGAVVVVVYVYGDRTQTIESVLRAASHLAVAKPFDLGQLDRSIRMLLARRDSSPSWG